MEPLVENIELIYLTVDDYHELKDVMIDSYRTMPNSVWKEDHIKTLVNKFPEGQLVSR